MTPPDQKDPKPNDTEPNDPEPNDTEPNDTENDPLVIETRRRRDRRDRWLREGDMSVGRRLAQIGVLGWIFVLPTLAGLFFGRWLDARYGTGIFWSAPCMVLGLCVGFYSAWKWMNSK